VEVVEPLKSLRLTVGGNSHGIRAEILFRARAPAVEEPRFTYRIGPRTVLDYTRLTQNGCYEGTIELGGRRFVVTPPTVLGTRDRSWGVRPIGQSDPQMPAPPRVPQFYWLWSPLNFEDRFLLYHRNADGEGRAWNSAAVMGGLGDAQPLHMAECRSEIVYKPGTRHAKAAVIEATDRDGGRWRATLTAQAQFYMSGIGYGHPEWGHGMYRGVEAVGYDTYDLATLDENEPRFQHIQALVTAELEGPGVRRSGRGVLEQLVAGPYRPHGLTGLFDPAPG
ncbi:MAG: hypothetical protein JO261_00280, partial [Alphaproteobacteria bacterium]|nr:hypothetical protein [Alphaproteobacteria bacterium]